MPSDANGVFSLVPGYLAVTGETIQASQHNPVLEDIASAMSQRLMRSGAAPMTGPLKLSDGSAGAPAVQFNSDGTTGFYKTANGIGVAIGGVKVVEFTTNGIPRKLGELIPYTFLTALETDVVFPNGQTLLRASYPDMWSKVQTEIAAGNQFYNNGNGSTTFGIGDLRGRVLAGKDNMGGSAAGRLTSASGITGTILGAAGGFQSVPLALDQLPNATLSVNIPSGQGTHAHGAVVVGGNSSAFNGGENFSLISSLTIGSSDTSTIPELSGTAALNGSGNGHNNVQPTLVCNFLLYVGA